MHCSGIMAHHGAPHFVGELVAGEDDNEPEVGPLGKHPSHEESDEYHGHEGGAEDGGHVGDGEYDGHEGGGGEYDGHEGGGEYHGHEDGEGDDVGGAIPGNDPDHVVDGALLCFHEKHIYSSCDESCRLSASGELNVPHDQVDEFCHGPCLEETNLVLDCLDGIMDRFLFYNRATTQDVRDTILAGCGHGEHRGDFDVEEYIEDDEGSASTWSEPKVSLLSVIVVTVIWQILVLNL